jgi:hypothetical protein
MNIYEVLQYGPILASNQELGVLITINGAYLNAWVSAKTAPDGDVLWTNTEAYDMASRTGSETGLYGLGMTDAMDAAEALLAEVIGPGEEE